MEDNARPLLAAYGYTVWKLDERDEHGFRFRVTVDRQRQCPDLSDVKFDVLAGTLPPDEPRPEVVYSAARLRDACEWIDHQFGYLHAYPSGDYVRAATPDEARMSAEAGRDGIPGVFTLNGHQYYVTEDHEL